MKSWHIFEVVFLKTGKFGVSKKSPAGLLAYQNNPAPLSNKDNENNFGNNISIDSLDYINFINLFPYNVIVLKNSI